ncbi:MAG: Ig-like domain-containing protein [Oscillospiraceae bacterium]|nr:Ig-like domain-containing protein [Oscillospiraceae bacterium]
MSKEQKQPHEHHHLTAEELGDRLEHNQKSGNRIFNGLAIFLCIIFLGGMAWGANDILNSSRPSPPEAAVDDTITNPPQSAQEILDYIQAAIADAKAQKPRIETNTAFDYDDNVDFVGLDSAALKDWQGLAKLMMPDVTARLQDSYPSLETQFGEAFDELLWALRVVPAQLEDATCEFVYFRCNSCGKEEGEPLAVCPECRAKNAYQKQYRENYTFTLLFKDDDPSVFANFHPRSPEEMRALLKDDLRGYATLGRFERNYDHARVVVSVNRVTKKLQSIRFLKDIAATLTLDVNPDFANLGTVTVVVNMSESTNFNFTWLGVYLSLNEKTMDKNETAQLAARIDAPNGQKTPLIWRSSNEKICAVDVDGYLETGGEYGEATITASFGLNGKVYEGTCVVYVKVPVEKVKLSHRRLRLAPGETQVLKATVTPKNATNQNVTWGSDATDVATVADGLVRAVGPGKTNIWVCTEDGYYKLTCTVTVTRGGE